MSITVMTASQTWRMVWRTQVAVRAGERRTSDRVMRHDTRIAVPVASGWKAQIAA
jgi:hypothetical protein